MYSVNSLFFQRRIPPNVHQNHTVGRGEVEAQGATFQRDQHDSAVAVVFQSLQRLLSQHAGHGSVVSTEPKAVLLERLLYQIQHGRELTEYDGLFAGIVVSRVLKYINHLSYLGACFEQIIRRSR